MVLDGINAELWENFTVAVVEMGELFFGLDAWRWYFPHIDNWVLVRIDDIITSIRGSGEKSHEDKPPKSTYLSCLLPSVSGKTRMMSHPSFTSASLSSTRKAGNGLERPACVAVPPPPVIGQLQ